MEAKKANGQLVAIDAVNGKTYVGVSDGNTDVLPGTLRNVIVLQTFITDELSRQSYADLYFQNNAHRIPIAYFNPCNVIARMNLCGVERIQKEKDSQVQDEVSRILKTVGELDEKIANRRDVYSTHGV